MHEGTQAIHGGFQDSAVGGVADANGAFAVGTKSDAGSEANPGFEEEAAAEVEGIGEAGNAGEEIEGAVGTGNGEPRHFAEGVEGDVVEALVVGGESVPAGI